MPGIAELASEALSDFRQVAVLARVETVLDQITVQILPKPHRAPPTLPLGRMAVYAFFLEGRALKVGKVGPKSAARYTSQHYNAASAQAP